MEGRVRGGTLITQVSQCSTSFNNIPRGEVWADSDPGLSHCYVNHTCPY